VVGVVERKPGLAVSKENVETFRETLKAFDRCDIARAVSRGPGEGADGDSFGQKTAEWLSAKNCAEIQFDGYRGGRAASDHHPLRLTSAMPRAFIGVVGQMAHVVAVVPD
jgi:hypothetical protein